MKDREAYNEYQREYQLKRYHKRREEAFKFLGGKCVKCGIIEKLEIDHIDRTQKTLDLAKLWSVSKKRFLAELEKCQLLCNDCHKKKSTQEREVPHGGGVSGKRNCYCVLCAPIKRAYNREWKENKKLEEQIEDF